MRTTRKLLESTKQKISNSMKGMKNPNYGKSLTPEHKNKIRKSMLIYWSTVK